MAAQLVLLSQYKTAAGEPVSRQMEIKLIKVNVHHNHNDHQLCRAKDKLIGGTIFENTGT